MNDAPGRRGLERSPRGISQDGPLKGPVVQIQPSALDPREQARGMETESLKGMKVAILVEDGFEEVELKVAA